jgi:type IV pilus assembly protein PilV
MPARAHRAARRLGRGITLIEVLVALLVVSLGLMGAAKMQALAISSTRTSSMRALISIEAASLASAMHANKGYWATGMSGVTDSAGSFTVSVSATGSTTGSVTLTSSDSALTGSYASCVTASCTPAAMAIYDLYWWAIDLQSLVPGASSSISCTGSTTAIGDPVNCGIQITWLESYVGANGAYASGAQTSTQTYNLAVEP